MRMRLVKGQADKRGGPRCGRWWRQRRFVVLLLPILLWAGSVLALAPEQAINEYSHDLWQTEQGLPSNSIQAITQTPDGYLWLGTKGGLVRFDGVRFTVFDKINTTEIKSNDILALCVEHEGSLWIGTYGGGLVR